MQTPGTWIAKSRLHWQYDASNSSAFLQRIFKLQDKDELTWYYPLTLRASNRLLILERKEGEPRGSGDIYAAGLTLGAVYLHSYMQEEDLTLNVSTAPDYSWQSWLPDEIAVDAQHGGVDLSWYQGRRIGKKGWRWDVYRDFLLVRGGTLSAEQFGKKYRRRRAILTLDLAGFTLSAINIG